MSYSICIYPIHFINDKFFYIYIWYTYGILSFWKSNLIFLKYLRCAWERVNNIMPLYLRKRKRITSWLQVRVSSLLGDYCLFLCAKFPMLWPCFAQPSFANIFDVTFFLTYNIPAFDFLFSDTFCRKSALMA